MARLAGRVVSACWLCDGLGGIALHERWTAERGKPLFTGHDHPTDDPHETRPCPACCQETLVNAMSDAMRTLLAVRRTVVLPAETKVSVQRSIDTLREAWLAT